MTEKSKTFDFGDHRVVGTEFEDIDSTADELLVARGGVERSRFRRIHHDPGKKKILGAVTALATLIVALLRVFGLLPF